MSKKNENPGGGLDKEEGIIEERTTSVGLSKKNRNFAVAAAVLLTVTVVYYVFDSGEGTKDIDKKEAESSISIADQRKQSIPVVRDYDRIENLPPKIPEIPDIITPPVPTPPAPPTLAAAKPMPLPLVPRVQRPPATLPSVSDNLVAPQNDRSGFGGDEPQDRASQMLVVAGKGTPENDVSAEQGINLNNPLGLLNSQTIARIKGSLNDKPPVSESASLSRTAFPQVQTTYVGLLDFIIAQGKVIDAVIESSINTDLQGMLRAIVQRDVYSESGTRVLVPRGSRLIGRYDNNISFGQTRVSIVWDRLMLPNGIDIAIGSPATDPLGKTGISGRVDAKFGNVFVNALLISAIKVGTSALVSKMNGGDQQIVRTVDQEQNTVTTSGDGVAVIANDAAQQTSDALTQYLDRYKDTKPTIMINQGQRIKVFVNKDLVFSKAALGGA